MADGQAAASQRRVAGVPSRLCSSATSPSLNCGSGPGAGGVAGAAATAARWRRRLAVGALDTSSPSFCLAAAVLARLRAQAPRVPPTTEAAEKMAALLLLALALQLGCGAAGSVCLPGQAAGHAQGGQAAGALAWRAAGDRTPAATAACSCCRLHTRQPPFNSSTPKPGRPGRLQACAARQASWRRLSLLATSAANSPGWSGVTATSWGPSAPVWMCSKPARGWWGMAGRSKGGVRNATEGGRVDGVW